MYKPTLGCNMTFYIVGVTQFISNWQNESLGHNLISNKTTQKVILTL